MSDGRWHHVTAVAIHGKHGTSILFDVAGILEKTDRGGIADLQTETEHNVCKTIRMGRHPFEDKKLVRGYQPDRDDEYVDINQ
ncbi:hypothetical protein [Roseimaritima multifibrata]|uniref:hypothetical protein n=1 Tax=Roseimaritima multifibrata TaxID=1930274 RepID=UPI001C54EE11|nr:hypothetical protein [Roseimaritima multifibrata]